ncbi:hypothetical protein KUL42_32610 [Alteromonas sp. KUL42]|uniref:P27 family phage terminase small subunit n=1 Tax=Alteromonas sp. KUL42 TaxID=2480797 RepID=UPI001035B33C|nr:P27 family phage terminase small subunit [Alteromonas sp. KUL42]TAP33281.1 hypothetical protein EYR97_15365 [Alteromonas sp. KUL42]GEA08500.1 hypothetical protein KUL42_32610 [Alteromonas sp. KUL42]
MGRPRKSESEKKALGTHRKSRAVEEVDATGELLDYKELTCTTANKFYEKLREVFADLNILGAQDSFTLREIADEFAALKTMRKDLKAQGVTYKTVGTNGQTLRKLNPLFDAVKKSEARYDSLLDKIGANPRARAAIANINSQTDSNELLLEIFGKKIESSAQLDLLSMPMNAASSPEKPIN